MKSKTKFIFVTGGVLSGVGKGISAASVGNILKSRGLNVNIQKLDPYLNVDAGTLNPAEHGECFVTVDGAETDLDLGHYERFMDVELTQKSSTMSGKILRQVIDDERAGKYLGKTVQYVPHVTMAMQEHIEAAAEGFDVHIVEIGGTIGDIEGQGFVEAIRELGIKYGRENCIYIHVVYLPYLGASKEFKTKPAQNAVKDLRNTGIVPDMIMARSEQIAPDGILEKLSLFCGVPKEAIALLPNAETVYQVPLTLEDYGCGDYISKRLKLSGSKPKNKKWRDFVDHVLEPKKTMIKVGMVAKYLDNEDSYFSVVEALRAAGWENASDVQIVWIDAEKLENDPKSRAKLLRSVDGIVVPGGFGSRGIEGKILAADYAMKNNIPYLGLCLGMQVAAIAAARQAGLKDANSTEFNSTTSEPVITTMTGQVGKEGTGGTMRLGAYECSIKKGSLASKLYRKSKISERHRHRYELNSKYTKVLSGVGIEVSGTWQEQGLAEIIEKKDHPFFIACQFHPEFTSRPNRPHPLFVGFINTLKKNSKLATIKQ
jgi:CTP synthase